MPSSPAFLPGPRLSQGPYSPVSSLTPRGSATPCIPAGLPGLKEAKVAQFSGMFGPVWEPSGQTRPGLFVRELGISWEEPSYCFIPSITINQQIYLNTHL